MSYPTEQLALILPEPKGSFVVKSTQVRTPAEGELLVKIHSTALNPIDWKIAKYDIVLTQKDYPAVIGFEAAGEVVGLGEGVEGWAKGDRLVFQGKAGSPHMSFQQYATVPYKLAVKIPSKITYDEAATIPVAYTTAFIGLYHPIGGAGRTPPWAPEGQGAYSGKPLLVLGGSGSVGQLAIQLGKLSGFSPIIVTASPKHTAHLTTLGATHVIPRDDPLTSATLASITSDPLLLVYDAVGATGPQQAGYDLLATGGQLVSVGQDVTDKGDDVRGRKVISIWGSAWPEFQRALGLEAYDALPGYLERDLIKPSRFEVVPGGLAGIPGGLQRMEEGKVGGFRLVVHPQESK